MKTAIAAVGAVSATIAIGALAVPAVAIGAEYYLGDEATVLIVSVPLSDLPSAASTTGTAGAPRSTSDLIAAIAQWIACGALLLGRGAVAVVTSVRRQRKVAT